MKGVKSIVTAIAVMGFVNCYGYAVDLNSQSMNAGQTVSTTTAQLGKGVPVAIVPHSDDYRYHLAIYADGSMFKFDSASDWNFSLWKRDITDLVAYPVSLGIPVAAFRQFGYNRREYVFADGSLYQDVYYSGYSWRPSEVKNVRDMEGYPLEKGVPVAAFEWSADENNNKRMFLFADGSVYRFYSDWILAPESSLKNSNIRNAPAYPKEKGVPVAAYTVKSGIIYFIFADGSHYRVGADSTQWKFKATQFESIYKEKDYPKLADALQVSLSLEHDMSLLGGSYKIYNNSKNQARLKVKASVYSENEYYERTYYEFDMNQLLGALTLYDQQDDMKPQHFSLQRNDYLLGTFNQTRALSSAVELGELVNYELKSSDKIEKSGYIYFTSAAEQYHLYNLCIKYMENEDRSNGGTCNKQTTLVEGKVPLQYSRASFEWQLYWRWSYYHYYTLNIYKLIDASVKIRSIYNPNASIYHDNNTDTPPRQIFNQGVTSFNLLGGSKNPGKIMLEKGEVSIYNSALGNKKGCYDQWSPLIVEDEYGNTSKFNIDFGYGQLYQWVMEQGQPLSDYRCLNVWS